jgi:hypothetical protein
MKFLSPPAHLTITSARPINARFLSKEEKKKNYSKATSGGGGYFGKAHYYYFYYHNLQKASLTSDCHSFSTAGRRICQDESGAGSVFVFSRSGFFLADCVGKKEKKASRSFLVQISALYFCYCCCYFALSLFVSCSPLSKLATSDWHAHKLLFITPITRLQSVSERADVYSRKQTPLLSYRVHLSFSESIRYCL